MEFNRPPRIQPDLPEETVEIPEPRNIPAKPGALNVLSIGLPLGAVLLTVVLMSSGGAGGLSYLRFLPIMLATYLATGLTFVLGNRNYKKDLAKERDSYRNELRSVEARLQDQGAKVRQVWELQNPPPGECLQRARRKDPRLGERRPGDHDFLALRLGIGAVPAPFEISTPETKKPPEGFAEEYDFVSTLRDTYSIIHEAPIAANLSLVGSIGIAGELEDANSLARALIGQLVTHHWPGEVQLAGVGTPSSGTTWDWTGDLPQLSGSLGAGFSIESLEQLNAWMNELEGELQDRDQLREAHQKTAAGREPQIPLPRLVLLFSGLPQEFKHPAMARLLRDGRHLGVHGIFLAKQPEFIPGECGAVVAMGGDRTRYSETGEAGLKAECVADGMSLAHAASLAKALGSIEWPLTSNIAQPPASIGFLEMLGVQDVESLPIEDWWDGQPPWGYLRVPIGRISATADLIFDLNDKDGAHGPHGLIGGMTGSGKSEILKTILLSLAATHNPYDLNFALIDYKGGAAFNELAQLPHTVGVVTDIESHATYAERVIQALAGEIEHRKRVLERARSTFSFGRSHIDEYRQIAVRRPMPRLVIVFDEFAEFKQRNPEESKRLISFARLGRSLGVHLILATQNIEAAVDPEILQNSTFRLCLRVSQAQDSVQMIGIPDAVNLPRGRAYFLAQTRQLFQAAYAGGAYRGTGDGFKPRQITWIKPDGIRESAALPELQSGALQDPARDSTQYSETQAVVDRIVACARRMRLKRPPAVWPDPLPARIYLPEVLSRHFTGGWDGSRWLPARAWRASEGDGKVAYPVLGIYDQPAEQRQVVFQIDPDKGGQHLLVFGSAGSGKSSLLRTLVSSLARLHTPDHAHIYIMDFGGQSSLKVLEGLPHVGAVVTRFEEERTARLMAFMHAEFARRNELLRKRRVDNWRDYNGQAGEGAQLPALYLLIDGYGEFKRSVPAELAKSLITLVGGGAATGLFLVISSSLQSELPNDLFANINLRLTFHQADQTEYFRIVGRPSEAKIREDIERPPPPGRGLLRGTPPLEFQAALPVTGKTDDEQISLLGSMASEMSKAWRGETPQPIQSLPMLISLPHPEPGRPVTSTDPTESFTAFLGRDYETLSSVELSLRGDGPAFLVAGVSPQSGKTSLLRTWVIGLAEHTDPAALKFIFFDFHTRTMLPFRNLPHTQSFVGASAGMEKALAELIEESKRRSEAVEKEFELDPDHFDQDRLVAKWPRIFVIIDDYDRFASRAEEGKQLLADCLATGGELGIQFAVAGDTSELPRDFDDPFIRDIRKHGCGVLLSGMEGVEQFNKARRIPGEPGSGLPAGRGYLIKRGQARLIQSAVYWQEGQEPDIALNERIEHLAALHAQTVGTG